jgi:hypothetical protein
MRKADRLAQQAVHTRTGLAGQAAEINRLRAATTAAVGQAVVCLGGGADRQGVRAVLIAWCRVRYWHEIGAVGVLGEELRRYGLTFTRPDVRLLARQLAVEAEHFARVGWLIERLGGTIPAAPPRAAGARRVFLGECLARHPLAAIAAGYVVEGAGLGLLDAAISAGRRHELPDVVQTFRKVIKEDRFNIILERVLLERYTTTEDDGAEVGRAMRGMASIIIAQATAARVE